MICVPHGVGTTGEVFAKNKSVYYNDFEQSPYFIPETDNLKETKNVKNFVIFPMVGHDDTPNGVVQMYSFKQPISRLKMKKLIAMKKFLGGCLEKVTMQNTNLEYQVGIGSNLPEIKEAIDQQATVDKEVCEQMTDLRKLVDPNVKWITHQHNRTLNTPGFDRIPTPPIVEDPAEERRKKKLAEKLASGENLDKVEEENEGNE